MKIVSLEASNIKRVRAVSITPTGEVVTIGGKNRAGKSSVLDAIAYALGGQDLVPEEPIRRGEAEAVVKVDLGDIVVTRRFYREVIDDKDAGTTRFGPTKSTLTVRNRENASYPSPQALLDKLLGELTFDPREFAMAKPKVQLETLRKITNLDTTLVEEARREAFHTRTAINKQVTAAKVILDGLPPYIADVPAEEVSLDAVLKERSTIEGLKHNFEAAMVNLGQKTNIRVQAEARVEKAMDEVDRLKKELERAENSLIEERQLLRTFIDGEKEAITNAERAKALIPTTDTVSEKLTELQELNKKVRQNAVRRGAELAWQDLVEKSKTETATIEELDRRKAEMIAAVKFPIEGLGFGEEGVLLNGLPFEQASTSEQLSVSVAIGLALNSKLRVLLVRNGESLDSDAMRLLAELAEKHEAQLWVERMTESKEGVSVMIEDGQAV